jgi:hypothetical protein
MMIHHAKVARQKEHGLLRQGKYDIAPSTPKGWTSRMKHWKGPECKIGIKAPDTRRQLCLKIERTSEGIDRNAFKLEFMKRATRMFNGLRKMMNWALWRGRPPPKRKNKRHKEQEPVMQKHLLLRIVLPPPFVERVREREEKD